MTGETPKFVSARWKCNAPPTFRRALIHPMASDMGVQSWMWLMIGAVGGSAIIAILHTLATCILWQHDLHHLKIEAHRLRAEYERRKLARENGEFEIIEEPDEIHQSARTSEPAEAA